MLSLSLVLSLSRCLCLCLCVCLSLALQLHDNGHGKLEVFRFLLLPFLQRSHWSTTRCVRNLSVIPTPSAFAVTSLGMTSTIYFDPSDNTLQAYTAWGVEQRIGHHIVFFPGCTSSLYVPGW